MSKKYDFFVSIVNQKVNFYLFNWFKNILRSLICLAKRNNENFTYNKCLRLPFIEHKKVKSFSFNSKNILHFSL